MNNILPFDQLLQTKSNETDERDQLWFYVKKKILSIEHPTSNVFTVRHVYKVYSVFGGMQGHFFACKWS